MYVFKYWLVAGVAGITGPLVVQKVRAKAVSSKKSKTK